MSYTIPNEIVDKLRCVVCNFYVSVGPVTRGAEGYHCGRCPSGSEERHYLYETAVHHFKFPCKYEPSGCDERCLFGQETKDHEATCDQRPFSCPLSAVSTCEWQGTTDEMYEHCEAQHATNILDKPVVDVNVEDIAEQREDKDLSVVVTKIVPNATSDKETYRLRLTSKDKSEFVEVNRKLVWFQAEELLSNTALAAKFNKHILMYVSGDTDVITLEVFLKCEEPTEAATSAQDNVEIEVSRCAECSKTRLERYSKCGDGHVLCMTCAKGCKTCTTCNKNVQIYSDYKLMKEDVFYLCRHNMLGCNFIDHLRNIEDHEKLCAIHECPHKEINKCPWRGVDAEILKHYREVGHWVADTIHTLQNKCIQDSYDTGKYYCVFINYDNIVHKIFVKADKKTGLVYISAVHFSPSNSNTEFCIAINNTTKKLHGKCYLFKRDEDRFKNCIKISWDAIKNWHLPITIYKNT